VGVGVGVRFPMLSLLAPGREIATILELKRTIATIQSTAMRSMDDKMELGDLLCSRNPE
jgi:hypothetical protein